ncbi:MAG: glutamine amidotransferase class-I [Thermoleophilia bacterium]|nr:glutamine amidotransferase class-I [Thermoleophilia bacterium]
MTRVDEQSLPPVEAVTRLIVLGGQMNTDDVVEHPWLDVERAWLSKFVTDRHRHVFGICLGSQLLAEVLGGAVTHAPTREIGWHHVELTAAGADSHVFGGLPQRFEAFEWHGDTWSLPPGADLAITGATCANQAFTWGGRVHGVQFHPEFEYERVQELAATSTDDLTVGGSVQTPAAFLAHPERFLANESLLDTLLDRALLGVAG